MKEDFSNILCPFAHAYFWLSLPFTLQIGF
jgi:hypothetical protein